MLRGEKLGEGTFGIVYSATSPGSKRKFAIKRNLVEDGTSFIGVTRELDVLNKLRHHPHIVRLERVAFDEVFPTGSCFSPLAGQYRTSQRNDSCHFVFGQATSDLHTCIYEGPSIPDYSLLQRYMVNVLLGLEYIHSQKIIHRDIKPGNILIFNDEVDALGRGAHVAKICDFGFAKPFTYQVLQTPSIVTASYRPPEVCVGFPHYDYKVDIWSTGCMLFEMVAQRFVIETTVDNNEEILALILKAMPRAVPTKRIRELTIANPWRDPMRLPRTGKFQPAKTRTSWRQKMALTPSAIAQFERQAGPMAQFCDLLDHLLEFEWDHRWTATQALDHPFFAKFAPLIAETRAKYPLAEPPPRVLNIKQCIERKWMAEIATEIFNNRWNYVWYSHRVLFQAMDMYDRYLLAMFSVAVPSNAVETEYRGRIHDQYGATLRFYVCLHLCVKYFSSIHYPVKYEDMVPPDFQTTESLLEAENFERGFISNCLSYHLYQDTLFEMADRHNHKLGEEEVMELIVLYTRNPTVAGRTIDEIYAYYCEHLRGRSFEELFQPLPGSVVEPEPEPAPVRVRAPRKTRAPVRAH